MTAGPEPRPRAMRTRGVPACPACGGAGAPLHEDLVDRLFGTPGTWRIVRCVAPECGTLWLDPAPHADDLALAYADYYTHGATGRPRRGPREALRRRALRGYYAERYGPAVRAGAFDRLLASLVLRSTGLREYFDRVSLLQPPVRGGRALDIGCGDGETVAVLADLGWEAEGVDFDPAAVARARARGLRVGLGTVEAQGYADASFDLLGMSHVIEHVPDPVATLRECRRLLRPRGRLVLATPNARSLGHRRYGRDWRGLEPPRHLQVFTPESLRATASRAGVAVRSLTAPALAAAFASAESRRIAGNRSARTGDADARAFAREEEAALAEDAWAGEELLLVAEPA